MPLSDELNKIRSDAVKASPEATAKFGQAIEDLSRSGIAARSLKSGDLVPEFSLPNAKGKVVTLKETLSAGPVIVSFFRGGWCVFCTAELRALQNALSEMAALDTHLIAISPQTPDASLATVEDLELSFEVLSDSGNQVARQFGIVYHVEDELQTIYKELGLSLPEQNNDHSFDLPVPATYVIDQSRKIRSAFVDADYTRRLDPVEILSVLRKLKAES